MNTVSIEKSRKTAVLSVRTISMTAMLSAVAYLLAFVEFPVPLSPSFARMDLSDLPALIGAFAFGPLSGLLIELVKKRLAASDHLHRRHWRDRQLPDGRSLCGHCGFHL